MINWRKNQVDGDLTKKEKVIIYILCLLNPIFVWTILYYGWKKKLPIKAKKANKISFISFWIEVLISIIIFVPYFINSINTINEANNIINNSGSIVSGNITETGSDESDNTILDLLLESDRKIIESEKTGSNVTLGDAEVYIDKALLIDPSNETALDAKIDILIKKHEIEKARPYYQKAITLYPKHISEYFSGIFNK